MIDVYASATHYLDHCLPVFEALPEGRRGKIYGPVQLRRALAGKVGVEGSPIPRSDDPVIVAAAHDLNSGGRRPKVLIEHGAGQSYSHIDHPSYAGGPGRERVGLFICPRADVARTNLDRYPNAAAAVVGSPRLDRLMQIPKPANEKPVVAITFHWPCPVTVESGNAFAHFAPLLPELALRYKVLGHAHPRARSTIDPTYRLHGVEIVHDVDELFARADVLVVDNSSLGYEWAACGRPTVWLNAPEWRRDVEHGLRYWSHIPGPQVDDPADVGATVEHALRLCMHGEPPHLIGRWDVQDYVYGGLVDGHATERAAAAIVAFANHEPIPCSIT